MMDQSITRRGQPCWYKVEGVNNIAINDSFMLEGAIYHLLKVHFRQEKYYVDLLELFHEVTMLILASYLRHILMKSASGHSLYGDGSASRSHHCS